MKHLFYILTIVLLTLASCESNLYTTKVYDDAYYSKSKEEVMPSKTTTADNYESNPTTPEGTYNPEDGYYHNDDGTVTYYTEGDNKSYSDDYSYGNSDSYYDYDGSGNYIENNYYYIGDDYYYTSHFRRFGTYYTPVYYYDPYWDPWYTPYYSYSYYYDPYFYSWYY